MKPDLQGPEVQVVLQDLKVKQAGLVQEVHKDSLDGPVLKVRLVLQGHVDLKALQDGPVHKVHKVLLDGLVDKVLLGLLGRSVVTARLEELDSQDQEAHKVHKALLDGQVHRDKRETPVYRDGLETLALRVSQVSHILSF